MELALDGVNEKEVAPVQGEKVTYVRRKKSKPVGRHPLPAHLPRVRMVIEPEEDTEGMKLIGKEVTELLGKRPASYYVLQIIRHKYAKADSSGTVIGKMPERAIEKGMVDESFLADMIVGKFVDHLLTNFCKTSFWINCQQSVPYSKEIKIS